MNFRIHADQDRVVALRGRGRVDGRKRVRLDYTRRRVAADEGTGYDAHMHLGHLIEYFHDVIVTEWRHLAHAAGVSLQVPFAGRGLLETALSVPPSDRFARFAVPPRDRPTRIVQYKHLPKRLLSARLPSYDTRKPKGHGLLPTDRYLEDGPLSTAFDHHPLPEFVPENQRESVREGTGEVTWYALTYAIWRDRVLENPDLAPLDATTVIERPTVSA